MGTDGIGCLVDLEGSQQITPAACSIRSQRLSMMGFQTAWIPISGTPDSLLLFSIHCALTIL